VPHIIADRLYELSGRGPMALYTDIDGTLAPIAPTPDSATLAPGAADALRAIHQCGIRVVGISGRAAHDARALVGLDELSYAGNHGFELLTPDGPVIAADVAHSVTAVASAMAEINADIEQLPAGVLVENKTYTGSVHYRLTDDHPQAIAILRPLLTDIASAHGLILTEGRMVFEIRPALQVNKGVFLRNDVANNNIRYAAFLGDDVTDVDGFRAIHDLVAAHELADGAAIAVLASESPRAVIEESDLRIQGVDRLIDELTAFAEALQKGTAL